MRHKSKTTQADKAFYYMYGRHSVTAALANKKRVIKNIFCTKEVFDSNSELIKSFNYEILTNEGLASIIPPKQNHQGIVARVKTIYNSDINVLNFNAEKYKIAILDQITDPQNIGAIVRSAAAFGINALIMPSDNTPDESASIAKTASGCLELVEIVKVTNLKSTMDYLKKCGFWIVGLDGRASQNFGKDLISDKLAIVLGSEDTGPRRLTKEACDYLAKIPMSEKVESLNVSNAAAIIFHALY